MLVDTLGCIRRHLEITENADQAVDTIGRPLERRPLRSALRLDDEGDDRTVFGQVRVFLAQDSQQLASELTRDA
jgi:hypothetical protein